VRLTGKHTAGLCAKFRLQEGDRSDPTQNAKRVLRSIARRVLSLTQEAAELEAALAPLVMAAAPRTSQLLGLGVQHTATLLVAAGENIERLRSESAFAHCCAVSPIPASSGRTTRNRLNPYGNRDANRALHMAVVVRLRYCPETRAYVQRREQEGRSKREAMRCLKRYLARHVYRSLRADLQSLTEGADAKLAA
jgi:transposase